MINQKRVQLMRATFIMFILVVCFASTAYLPTRDHANAANDIYQGQLDSFSTAIADAHSYIKTNNYKNDTLKTLFLRIRKQFKKLSVITDCLDPFETIQINSPALERTEDDNPGKIIVPHGLQQLENIIWQNDTATANKAAIESELNYLHDIALALKNETEGINKFSDENTWRAMRMCLVTLITKTITSFDTPLSLNAVDECKATFESLRDYIFIYSNDAKNIAAIKDIIQNAIVFLNQNTSFEKFDRAVFIKNYINPLSRQLTETVIALNYINTNERLPVNPLATTLFEENTFDVNFFSPNKRYTFTNERMLLGKALFFDTRFSSTGTRSCASCHKPEMAFTDGLKTAIAIDEKTLLPRNTPTLLNAVYQTKQFYDSRQTMLEFQVSNVVHNTKEMGGSIEQVAEIIRSDKTMALQFEKAYPGDKEGVTPYTIANALANYMRSLQSLHARFDKWMRNEQITYTEAEKNGFNLFMGKAKCGSCHFMPLFNGLIPPQFNETESEVIGVPQSLRKPIRLDADSGKYYFTFSTVHLHAFKTPTLRNIALTAPYMHNGVYKTLEEVIDFYNKGGGKGLGIAPKNQTLPFDKLLLTKKEKKDIIAFLNTLTDTSSYTMK